MKRKDYAKAQGLFQSVIDLKVPDSTYAPKAQAQLDQIRPILQDKAEYDAAESAASRNDLDGAIARFDKIANGNGLYASQAKARVSVLQKMKTEMAQNAELKGQFDAAVQAENSNDLDGALTKFKAIVPKGGSFGAEAQQHVKDITAKLNAQQGKKNFDAAVQAESAGRLDDAMSQFNALLSNPDFKDQAQAHIQQIKDKQIAAADQVKFDDAVKKQNSTDIRVLNDAMAEFKSLAARRPDAIDHVAAVSAKIAELSNPQPKPPNPTTPTTPTTPTSSGPRTGTVALIPSGDYQRWNGPVAKGQTMPDNSIEGGLKAVSLSLPPISGASAGDKVLFIIAIDPDGNVKPVRKTQDDAGLAPQVMAAAKAWKFNPPTVKGKPVSTNIQVRVTF